MNKVTNLKGIITEVIFHNSENGYVVAVLENSRVQATIVGYLPEVEKGLSYNLLGEWKTHATYGEQFVFTEYSVVEPEGVEAIELFLGSGAIKGIGTKTAALIVKMYGERTMDILENDIERLTEVNGIGKKKLEIIKESYDERRTFLRISLYFQEHGISTAYALKFYKIYGENTIEIIKENPYRLLREVPRIGFQKVDRMARMLGFDHESEQRIKQGIIYYLWRFIGDGNTCFPERMFLETASIGLEVGVDLVNAQLMDLAIEGSVRIDMLEGMRVVFLSQYYDAEKRVCNNLFSVKNAGLDSVAVNAAAVIRQVEEESGIKLSDNQKEAVLLAMREPFAVITGGPGTGKTTIINTIIRIFKNAGKSVAIAAPTGRAAKRIAETGGEDAVTIHRLLEYYYSENESSMVFGKNRENKLEYDVVIVDEASMIDLLLMDALLEAVSCGTRFVMVGDVDQLPPVGAGNVLRDILDSDVVPKVTLKDIFRQAGESLIVVNAHRINSGEMPFYNEKEKGFFLLRKNTDEEILQTILELCGRRLPEYVKDCNPVRDIQVLTPTKKGMLGSVNLNKELQKLFNPEKPHLKEKFFGDRIFREGDKVMQIKNNYRLEWKHGRTFEDGQGVFNGDVGYIQTIDLEYNFVEILFDDDRYVRYEFDMMEELELAYAMTVHKSQGSEFPIVVMPIMHVSSMLGTRNLLYTAVTRGKGLVTLVGRERMVEAMIDNNLVSKKYSGLSVRLRERMEYGKQIFGI